MFTLIYSFLFATAFAGMIQNLDLNDVSILLPLPGVTAWDSLPKAQTIGGKGVLLPETHYKSIPPLLGVPTNAILYSDFRVVAIRLDPCFHEGALPVRCKTQVRMVWQPLENRDEQTSTFDVSLHVFYELNEDEFKELLIQISQLKSSQTTTNDFLPLTVNPFLKKDGLTGNYYKKLSQIILKYVGEKNLSRITFMQLQGNGVVWDFGGFDFKDGEATVIAIPRVNSRLQRFINTATVPQPINFRGGMMPAPKSEENLNLLIRDSSQITAANEADIISAVRAAYRFENPSLHNPGTVDCVSCHVAQSVRIWSTRKFPEFNLESVNDKDTFKSDRNITNQSPLQLQTNVVRAFGYFMNRPAVSQRTINESADVIKYINENF